MLKIKSQLLTVFVIVFSIVGATAQTSLLFKISGNGHTSYLMGTHHMVCSETYQLPEKVKKAIASSEQLAVEIDFTNPEEMKSLQSLMMSGKKFGDIYTQEEIDKIAGLLSKFGVPVSGDSKYSMIMLVSLLSQLYIECPPQNLKVVDMLVIQNMAGKPIKGLETVAGQAKIIEDVITPKAFIESLDKVDEQKGMIKVLENAYITEDLEKMNEIVTNTEYMSAAQQKMMLDDRNIEWISPIKSMMKEKKTFIAVGAGHLLGEKGLISLLKSEGYTVEPVIE